MANTFISYAIGSTIVIWTDANLADDNYTRRNIIQVGSQCICLHGDFVPWVPRVKQILSAPNVNSLPSDQLAIHLSEQLRDPHNQLPNAFGLVVSGFTGNGLCNLSGLTSHMNYNVNAYLGSVVDGNLPISIWSYLLSVFSTIPQSLESATDLLLMAAFIYSRIGVLSQLNYSAGSAIVILSQNQNPYWVPEVEIKRNQDHNSRRLQSLQMNLTRQVQELFK
jgi:hypothetical protein